MEAGRPRTTDGLFEGAVSTVGMVMVWRYGAPLALDMFRLARSRSEALRHAPLLSRNAFASNLIADRLELIQCSLGRYASTLGTFAHMQGNNGAEPR